MKLDTREKLKKYRESESIKKFYKYHEDQEDLRYLG